VAFISPRLGHNSGVAIRDATRKVLWSLSGNQCARCKVPLVSAIDCEGSHAIVGQECHIVARSEAGPRGNAEFGEGVDEYPNLILLCANCHVVIDSQPEKFPIEALRMLKSEHEASVRSARTGEPPRIKLTGRSEPVSLSLMRSGDELMHLLSPSLSFRHVAPTDLTTAERAAISGFMQECADWNDIICDIGPQGFYDAAESIHGHLESLYSMRLVVLAGLQPLRLSGGVGGPTDWLEAVIKVIRLPEQENSSGE